MSRSGTCGVVIKQCHVRRRSPAPASPPSLWCRLLPWKPCSAHVLRLAVVCLASSSHVCESNMRNNRLRLCCRACGGRSGPSESPTTTRSNRSLTFSVRSTSCVAGSPCRRLCRPATGLDARYLSQSAIWSARFDLAEISCLRHRRPSRLRRWHYWRNNTCY